MSFHTQRLRRLRRAAGLLPMPSFYVPGIRLLDDKESDYIDHRYFSPAALRWADEVEEFRRKGGALPAEDAECFGRVWEAMRKGRAPTAAQVREYEKDRRWKNAEARIPELYAIEMHSRGVTEYGPDYELPDDVPGPGSAQELIFKYLYSDLGYRTPDSASTAFFEWKKSRRAARGTP